MDEVSIGIPCWVIDHDSFRRWFHSLEFPDEGRACFLNGEVIFDMSREQIYSHIRIKTVFTRVVDNLAVHDKSGVYYSDGLLISNLGAAVSNNPDGTFVSNESFRAESVRLVKGAEQGFIELEGSPDLDDRFTSLMFGMSDLLVFVMPIIDDHLRNIRESPKTNNTSCGMTCETVI